MAMPTIASLPNVAVPQDVLDTLGLFYKNLDDETEESVDAFADLFTEDGVLITPSVRVDGKIAIREYKKAVNKMWHEQGTWIHDLDKIFPFDDNWYMVNLSGHRLPRPGVKNFGGDSAVRMNIDRKAGDVKVKFFQVYLCAPPLAKSNLEI